MFYSPSPKCPTACRGESSLPAQDSLKKTVGLWSVELPFQVLNVLAVIANNVTCAVNVRQ
ncbi:MAG: hypothetical protein A2283_21095 [Lentisphaerae bacterium RIFOXYA12_FULL_48_11]|nr:MAG: hypothetical protein A2283_21095 [Lentisphaerae bacterium RIFOXYA12_FULL_48_11]